MIEETVVQRETHLTMNDIISQSRGNGEKIVCTVDWGVMGVNMFCLKCV